MWTMVNGESIQTVAIAAVVAVVFVIVLAVFLVRGMGMPWTRALPPLVLVLIVVGIGVAVAVRPKLDEAIEEAATPTNAVPAPAAAPLLTVERPPQPVLTNTPPAPTSTPAAALTVTNLVATSGIPASAQPTAPSSAGGAVPGQPGLTPVAIGTLSMVAGALDPKQAPFGVYDAKLVAAVQQHWFQLLEQFKVTQGEPGQVVVEFRLNASGRISDFRVVESEVGEIRKLLCQRAVQDLNPFQAWPLELRREVQTNYRDMRFSFNYN
jgi:hypothetical protein